jgi:hypothetical protein
MLCCFWGGVPVQIAFTGIEWECIFNLIQRCSSPQHLLNNALVADLLAVSMNADFRHHRYILLTSSLNMSNKYMYCIEIL